uniref:serine dehydratase-like n=1 Tax=Panthera onca TaxID=9690 RepID=UPI002953A0B7|nr:serine dehydratase-like [Panthera onca]
MVIEWEGVRCICPPFVGHPIVEHVLWASAVLASYRAEPRLMAGWEGALGLGGLGPRRRRSEDSPALPHTPALPVLPAPSYSVAKSLGAKTVARRALECTKELEIFSEVVDDAQAVSAVQKFLDDERMLVEPACGAALAVIYSGLLGRLQAEGRLSPSLASVVVIVCGGNNINSQGLQALKAQLGQS